MQAALNIIAMAPTQGGESQQSPMFMFVWLGIMIAIFYFMLIRPQKKREQERRNMINAVKTGDRVVVCGGMMGVVANVKDTVLVVKIADNVKIEVIRGAVAQVLEKGEKAPEQTDNN